jgi:hypothetical protein
VKKLKTLGAAIGVVAMTLTVAGCDVTQGGACNQIGSQHTNKDGTLFTCAKNQDTGKGYWYVGK